ncbi:MAG TPA: O-acetylhomoserine aminocarboxypropyltransferase/cysteine synthase family protein [Rectinemataceae bacterium]|nr:O-acetylhomoserine aminocarboxypropyltransferase/cysteine synthase family protein [Rectinemataceae bacterium]
MAENRKPSFETIAVQSGHSPDPTTLSRGVPVYRTSSFVFKSAEHAANLFGLKEFGNIYSRLGNPTNEILETRVSQLEGGAASVAVASGTAAIFNTVITIAKAGDEIVSATNLYGGTYTMFDAILPDLGIITRFANVLDPASFEAVINEKTRLIYIESIGNPVLDLADVDAISAVAKKHHLPLVVDGTFTTPYLLKTIEHGADIVINSLTKWLGGHGTAIGGIATDAGTFDWSDPKFTLFNNPDKNYHGLRWAIDLPPELRKIAFALRFRTVPLRNLGACLSPDNAWIFLQGIETLHVRMPKHVENALAVAKFLKNHPKVAWIRYPGLEGDPSYKLSQKLLPKGGGGMVVFGVKGGRAAGEKFIESLKLFSHLANVGDAKSLALHPASTSHSQLTEEQQKESGLTPDLVRLSIGIENVVDIIADLELGLAAV